MIILFLINQRKEFLSIERTDFLKFYCLVLKAYYGEKIYKNKIVILTFLINFFYDQLYTNLNSFAFF